MAVEQRLDPVIIATQGPVPGTRPRGNLGAVSHVAEFIQRHGFFFEQGQSARRVFPLNETRASVRCRACRIEVPKDKQVRTRIVDLLAPKSSAKFSLTRVVTVKIWRIDHPRPVAKEIMHWPTVMLYGQRHERDREALRLGILDAQEPKQHSNEWRQQTAR